jgi:hypothetical protein
LASDPPLASSFAIRSSFVGLARFSRFEATTRYYGEPLAGAAGCGGSDAGTTQRHGWWALAWRANASTIRRFDMTTCRRRAALALAIPSAFLLAPPLEAQESSAIVLDLLVVCVEAGLGLEVPVPLRRRAGVGEADRVVGVTRIGGVTLPTLDGERRREAAAPAEQPMERPREGDAHPDQRRVERLGVRLLVGYEERVPERSGESCGSGGHDEAPRRAAGAA